MKNVRILDCTLRDGGRIIECAFRDEETSLIINKLAKAKIDIIEVGFLRDWRDVSYNGNSTFFTDVDQITPLLGKKNHNTTYVAFIDLGMFDFDSLKPCDGTSIDGIRLGFTKNDYINKYDELIRSFKHVKQMGYKLFIQGVNSLNYNDKELLSIVDMVNEMKPVGFGIVDTYGAMYVDDVTRLYSLVDHNLSKDIAIDFHSHNNFQLSFSFAQEIIRLSHGTRSIVLDATLNGMGKGSGNLNTELIVDYLSRKMAYDYDLDIVLDAIDEHLYELSREHEWGYSLTAMMSGIFKSHPNNVIYLTDKYRLGTKDIKNILAMLDEEERQSYNYDKINKLYENYNESNYNDYQEMEYLEQQFSSRQILVLSPGHSLIDFSERTEEYINRNNPIIISVNFISNYVNSYGFFANKKRYPPSVNNNVPIICTSDVAQRLTGEIVVNHHSLIWHGYKLFNNSVMMLLKLLNKLHVDEIVIAGMDGFSENTDKNYFDISFNVERINAQLEDINKEISLMLTTYNAIISGKSKISLITPSMFENIIHMNQTVGKEN